MPQRFILLLALIVSLAMAAPATAAIKGGEGSLTLGAGGYLFDGQEKLKAGPELLVRLGYDLTDYLGIEGSFGYVSSTTTRASKLARKNDQAHAYLYRADVLLHLMPNSSFVPFLVAGGGVKEEIGSSVYGNRTSALFNAGLGAKMFVSENVALRGEYRQIGTTDYAHHLNYEAALGITWYFGRDNRPAAAAPVKEWKLVDTRAMESAVQPAPVVPAAPPAVEAKPAAQLAAEPSSVAVPVTVETTQPEPASATTTIPVIKNIMVVGNTIAIHTTAPVTSYGVMTLEKPARLAIDINGAVDGMQKKKVSINSLGIKDARIGTYPDKVRIVLDAAGKKLPTYRLDKSATGLDLVITF